MSTKRLKGTKNYLYIGTRGVEIDVAGDLPEGFYKITAIAAAASGLPATAKVGDIVYSGSTTGKITTVLGDTVIPLALTKIAFVTDVPNSAQKDKYEDTTQIDDAKSYAEGTTPDITGTLSGYFIAGDPTDDSVKLTSTVLSRFYKIVEDAGTGAAGIVYNDPTTGVFDFLLGRNETTVVGEYEIFQYLPAIIESLKTDKPMQGNQTFEMNYTVVGSENPCIYKRKITA